MVTFVTAR